MIAYDETRGIGNSDRPIGECQAFTPFEESLKNSATFFPEG